MAYNFSLGQGIAPYLLKNVSDLFGPQNEASLKMVPCGLLQALKSQPATINLGSPYVLGGINYIQTKYLQPATVNEVSSIDNPCANVTVNNYQEFAIPLNIFKSYSFFLEDRLVSEYTADCVRLEAIPGAKNTVAQGEVLAQIQNACNAVYGAIDQALLNSITFGTNVVTGSNAATTINITQNTTTLPLNDGITRMLTDAYINAIYDKPIVIGAAGNMLAWARQNLTKGDFGGSGLSSIMQGQAMEFFYDAYSAGIFGQNTAILMNPGACQLVEFLAYEGAMGGPRPTTWLGTIDMPMATAYGPKTPMTFDIQINYESCPTGGVAVSSLTDYYGNAGNSAGSPIQGSRGYSVTISKWCGLAQTPTNQFKPGSGLAGTNGVLRYALTNV